jgi:Holliday junction resolvase RusA-like endonuclease
MKKVAYILRFTIVGNQEDRRGNPIPYFRTTQGSSWNKPSQRYAAWKDYVRLQLDLQEVEIPKMYRSHPLEIKPFNKLVRGRTTATVFFRNEAHADPDNIVKGINDALFINDKHIDVHTDHECRDGNPRVEVVIEFYSL